MHPTTSFNTLRLQAIDALSGESIHGVFFEMHRESEPLPEEGLSNADGSCEFLMAVAGTYTVKTQKVGFLGVERQIHVKPEMLVDNDVMLTVPLVRNDYWGEGDKGMKGIAIMLSNTPIEGIVLKAIPSQKFSGTIDITSMQGYTLCQYSITNDSETPTFLRLVA